MDQWAYARGLRLEFIDPGRPTQPASIESFNGKFRDECLNEHWFVSLADARAIIEGWRQTYNGERPHSALGYATPAAYAERLWGLRSPPAPSAPAGTPAPVGAGLARDGLS